MKELHLFGKKIYMDKSPVLLDYKPDENWKNYFSVMGGEWEQREGYLIGTEPGNKGGILFTKESYQEDVMLSFTIAAVPPAQNDLNAVLCAHWDEKTNYLGESYVYGLNGWYEHKSGIERNGSSCLHASTTLYRYQPGQEVRICVGAVKGHCFMTVDDVLVTELIDPEPLTGGHVGFSPYCTRLKIRDIVVQKICWESFYQEYTADFLVT